MADTPLVLKARATRFDLSNTPLDWIPGDAQSTHVWNVLHLVLPSGERWFCDVFRDAAPLVRSEVVAAQLRGFIGQETTHAKAHDRGVEFLATRGVDFRADVAFGDKVASRLHKVGQGMPRPVARRVLEGELAAIAAIEHYTSVMGNWFVASRTLDEAGADLVMVDLIRWHASEEVEHRNVAFDVYQDLCGSYVRRAIAGIGATIALFFVAWPIGVTMLMHRDKTAKRFSWRHLRRAMRSGLVPNAPYWIGTLREFLKRDYHPSHYGDLAAAQAYLAYSPGVNRKTAYMDQFTNDGFTFDVTDAGPADGELIVLLHGFPESRDAWKEVTPVLNAAGFRTLAPNQRGYSRGARPKARRRYTLPTLGREIVTMADQAGVDRFHVVGHDWGGGVAWELAANHATRVITVTSMATPHPRAMVKSMVRSTQLLKSYYMLLFQTPGLPERGFTGPLAKRTWKTMEKSGLPASYIDGYAKLFAEPGAARGALNWYRGLFFGSPNGVGNINVPTMYVYGTGDFALGRKAADLTGDYVTGPYRYEILEGTSHWIPEELPDRSADLILDFIASTKSSTP